MDDKSSKYYTWEFLPSLTTPPPPLCWRGCTCIWCTLPHPLLYKEAIARLTEKSLLQSKLLDDHLHAHSKAHPHDKAQTPALALKTPKAVSCLWIQSPQSGHLCMTTMQGPVSSNLRQARHRRNQRSMKAETKHSVQTFNTTGKDSKSSVELHFSWRGDSYVLGVPLS